MEVGSRWFTRPPQRLHREVGKNRTEQRSIVIEFSGSFKDMAEYSNRTFSFNVDELTTFESRGNRTDLSKVFLAGLKVSFQSNSFQIPMCITIGGLSTNINSTLVIPASCTDDPGCILVDNLPFPKANNIVENFNFMKLTFLLHRFDDLDWNEPPERGSLEDVGKVSINIELLYRLIHVFEK